MADGALARSPADYPVAITGVAGPDPDEDGNQVGLVCLAVASRKGKAVASEKRYGDLGRARIQEQAMADALRLLIGAVRADC
jgi:nicotinamide-nucleotide amidase